MWRYQDETGQIEPKIAPEESFHDEEGKETCKKCSPETVSYYYSQIECEQCYEWLYQDEEGERECKYCTAGEYSKFGAAKCNECEDGTFSYDYVPNCTRCYIGCNIDYKKRWKRMWRLFTWIQLCIWILLWIFSWKSLRRMNYGLWRISTDNILKF